MMSNPAAVAETAVSHARFGGVAKRIEDLVCATLGLILAAVPMLAIAAAIRLSSAGPIIFRQRRSGLNGRPIVVLKFRTMIVLEGGSCVVQATVNDPRVTALGALLRRLSLDELPQLFNVLAGNMSFVGPRPHAIAHNQYYSKRIPSYHQRHDVKPGITGWAQVNGWRGETETLEKMSQRVDHDIAYVCSWDLILDIKIIFLTLFGKKVRQRAY